MIGKILFVVEPEIVYESLSVAPALFDLYPAVEIDFAHEEALHILTRLCRNFFEHLAFFADYYALVALALAVDCGVDIGYIRVLALMHSFYSYSNAVRHFVVEKIQKLLSDYLGGEHALGLVGQSVVGEEMRRGLSLLEQLVF